MIDLRQPKEMRNGRLRRRMCCPATANLASIGSATQLLILPGVGGVLVTRGGFASTPTATRTQGRGQKHGVSSTGPVRDLVSRSLCPLSGCRPTAPLPNPLFSTSIRRERASPNKQYVPLYLPCVCFARWEPPSTVNAVPEVAKVMAE